MNERQPFEQLIADKLEQLPVPDPGRSWPQMKRLLDKHSPPGGGRGGGGFPPGRNWFWAGSIALVLIGGWWALKPSGKGQQDLATVKTLGASQQPANKIASSTPGQKDNGQAGPANSQSVQDNTLIPNHSNKNQSLSNNSTLPDHKNKPQSNPAADKNLAAVPAVKVRETGGLPAGNKAANPAARDAAGNSAAAIRLNTSTANGQNAKAPAAAGQTKALAANRTAGPKSANPDKANNHANSELALNNTPAATAAGELTVPGSEPNSSKPGKASPGSGRRHLHDHPARLAPNAGTDLAKSNPAKSGTAATHPGHRRRPLNENAATLAKNSPGSKSAEKKGSQKAGTRKDLVQNNQPPKGDRTDQTAGDQGGLVKGRRQGPHAVKAPLLPADKNIGGPQEREPETVLTARKTGLGPEAPDTRLSLNDSLNAKRQIRNYLTDSLKKDIAAREKAAADKALAKFNRPRLALHLGGLKPFSLKNDGDAWWGVGLSLHKTIAVGGQGNFGFNANGGTGLLGDFLPSPYVQFHLNDYVYLQTELNLSMPQYTPSLLVFDRTYQQPGSDHHEQRSIYIKKLYYFNWPLSLHYSPVQNLYLSAGLQYSSFQSGLVQINEKHYESQASSRDTIYNNYLVKFKDDSIAARLKPNEWRWQLGMDYYFNRFTVGLRYNHAFSDLLNVSVNSSLPLTTGRNSAFLFLLKYNLFEGRRKDNAAVPRSLVRF